MSLPKEDKNTPIKLELIYSWSDLKAFTQRFRNEWILSILFLLLAFGQKLFSNSFSIDTESMVGNQSAQYGAWYGLDRFGLMWAKRILGLYWYNNAVASFLSIALLPIVALLWGYLFYGVTQNKDNFHLAFWAIPLLVSPVLAEQLGFLLQAVEINFGLIILPISLMMLVNTAHNVSRVKFRSHALSISIWIALTIIIFAFTISLYTAFVTIIISAVGMVYVLRFMHSTKLERSENKSFWTYICLPAILCIFGYILFSIVSKIVLIALRQTTNPYITNQMRWGKDSLSQIFKTIVSHAINMILANRIYYFIGFTIIAIFLFVLMLVKALKANESWPVMLMFAAVLASPLLMSVLLGSTPAVRTEFTYVWVASFTVMVLAQTLCAIRIQLGKIALASLLPWALVLYVGWSQALVTNRIFYTESVVYSQDISRVHLIAQQINALGQNQTSQLPVVFVGSLEQQGNPDTYSPEKLDLIGRSLFSITFSTEHGTWVKNHLFTSQGYMYILPNSQQINQADEAAKTMPEWPEAGSVKIEEGIIIVNLHK
ncbi:glucosyltransferase domain-containing protein [Alloscardovia sp. HMSC034E08]|uniref:glucosyltransferase domain-containing protein n=1 Tax=Alloscardovia sp. HMSC034E08 TaxID=1739413 RepID=UPI0008AEA317|nr:glucosyltransferase domain-containing protein [Alloscardovia sp. HMSC034E08]OFQ99508.1 hypothetical protein HMPREF2909_06380 [Alloscardovia sp. HMSC034E08]